GEDDLTTVAARVADALGHPLRPPRWGGADDRAPRPGALQGWFAGGTLAVEALQGAAGSLGQVRANLGPDADPALADGPLDGHVVVDLGADE
ncbi:FdrA family protein, partial [Enterococcus hirae]